MLIYVFSIDCETFEITDIRPRFRMDRTQFDMGDFHCGMADLEYDRDIPDDFGKGGECEQEN